MNMTDDQYKIEHASLAKRLIDLNTNYNDPIDLIERNEILDKIKALDTLKKPFKSREDIAVDIKMKELGKQMDRLTKDEEFDIAEFRKINKAMMDTMEEQMRKIKESIK